MSRDGLLKILSKICYLITLLSIMKSILNNMMVTIIYKGMTSETFHICNGVKQGCILAPAFFGIFFTVLFKHAFDQSSECIYLNTRSNGKLFNLSRLKVQTNVSEAPLRGFLYADDSTGTTHDENSLQQLIDHFSKV